MATPHGAFPTRMSATRADSAVSITETLAPFPFDT
jgi:hypothetical protein